MKILVDLDGVCADLYGRLVEWYNRDYKDSITPEDIKSWTISPKYFPKASSGEEIERYFNVPGFWMGLEPFEGCAEAVEAIQNMGHEIIIATAVPSHSELGFYEKCAWVNKYLPSVSHRNLVALKKKYLLDGDLLLDDGPHNIKQFHGQTCVMDAPYNRKVRSNYRVKSWKSFKALVEGLK